MTLVMAMAACGNKPASPPEATGTASGSGSGTTPAGAAGSGGPAPSVSTTCMPPQHKVTELVADASTATVCSVPDPASTDKTNPQRLFDDELRPPAPQCMAADLATGSWRETRPPAAPEVLEVRQDGKGVRVCKGPACTKLDVPPAKRAGKYLAAVSGDGKRAVVVADALKGAWWLDAATGAKLGELPISGIGQPLERGTALFLGERVYIAGTIYDWAGGPTGKVDLGHLKVTDLVSLGGDLHAFLQHGGIEIVNARTAATREVKIRGSVERIAASRGKLIAVSSELLAVIDPAAGTIEKELRIPRCASAVAARVQQPSLVLYGDHALGRIGARLVQFDLGGEPGQPAAAEEVSDHADDSGGIVAIDEIAYAVTRPGNAHRELCGGDPRDWGKVAGEGSQIMWSALRLVAADAGDLFWATTGKELYRLTKQGRRAARIAEFPENGDVVRSEPARLLVIDPLGEPTWPNFVSPDAPAAAKERRVVAIDKATGQITELVRGKLGFVRAIDGALWIVRDGTELLSIAEAATEATPHGSLPEAATSIEVTGDMVYFTPATRDRVLVAPIAGGSPTVVAGDLAHAEIIGASADLLFVSAADPKGQAEIDRKFAQMRDAPMPTYLPYAPAKRILGIARSGGPPKVLAGDLQTVRATVSGSGHIYVQIAACYESGDNGACIVDNPAIWVIDPRANRARRMGGVGSCEESFASGAGGVWLTYGLRLDQRTAPPVFLGGGIPDAAVGAGGALYFAVNRRIVRASTSGYEVIADAQADALAVGGSYLYFHDTEAARIGRIALQTGKLETIVDSTPSIAMLAADARGVYWWASASQSIEAANAPGAKRTVLAKVARPDGLAANAGRLAVLSGKRLTVVAADGTPRTVALGSDGAGVACDDRFVYWTENGDATVLQRDTWTGGDVRVVSRVKPQ